MTSNLTRSPTTQSILNAQRTPKYICCKYGFMKLYLGSDNNVSLLGYTPNLRTATPLYMQPFVVTELAKQIVKQYALPERYFAVIEPSLVGFDKEEG